MKPTKKTAPAPPPAKSKPSEPERQRQRGEPIKCDRCGADAFVRTSRRYPGWMRVQYVHCSNPECKHSWKLTAPPR